MIAWLLHSIILSSMGRMLLKSIKYCVALGFVFLAMKGYGQSPPWEVENGQYSMIFEFNGDVVSEISATERAETGDYIGLFYMSPGTTEFCIGYYQYTEGQSSVLTTSFREEGLAQDVIFKIWHTTKACQTDLSDYTAEKDGATWDGKLTLQGMVFVIALSGETAGYVLEYPYTQMCTDTIDTMSPLEEQPAAGVYHLFVVSTNASELFNVSSETGVIELSLLDSARYYVSLETDICVAQNRFDFEILGDSVCKVWPEPLNETKIIAPRSDNPEFRKLHFSEEGTIKVYNGNGLLVRQLEGPVDWHGNDQNGRLLPTDDYYIQFDSGEATTISILR